jgi:mRNA degradation ribonuclease J1/J2
MISDTIPMMKSSWSRRAARASPCLFWRAWRPVRTNTSRLRKEDTIILSSKFIPGNERAIAGIINRLYRLGADVIYEKISEIHVSGHAFQEELKLMINLTRPRYFIPIHGEYRHLTLHTRLAQEVGIPPERILLAENGQVIEFDEKGGRLRERVGTGRVLIDGKGVGDVGRSVLKERRNLSEHGLVVVAMALDEDTGTVVYGPEIFSRGFVFEMETGHLLDDAVCVVLEVVEDIGPEKQSGGPHSGPAADRPETVFFLYDCAATRYRPDYYRSLTGVHLSKLPRAGRPSRIP